MKTLLFIIFLTSATWSSAQRLTMLVEHIPQNYKEPKLEQFENVILLVKPGDIYVITSRDTLDLDSKNDGLWTDRRTGQRYDVTIPHPVGYRASFLFKPVPPYLATRTDGISLTARTDEAQVRR